MMDRKFYFIVNTHSKTGGAAAQLVELESKLRELNVDYEAFITQHVHHATELARELTT
ncbi:MAG: diacylglycerol kinase family lipid kinase, partial [Lachnospiraceae bacterium]|nr:diacylglycerol kinase family lipid kinase [Lachnospiraceae bacterium]